MQAHVVCKRRVHFGTYARRVKGMKLVVETLIRSLPSVFNVLVFGAFLFGIFAILGTQLFMGGVSRCNQDRFENGTKILNETMCASGTFTCNTITDLCDTDGDTVERWWGTPFRNFDHVGRSLLTLFILSTLDGFMDTAYELMDSTGQAEQPEVCVCVGGGVGKGGCASRLALP